VIRSPFFRSFSIPAIARSYSASARITTGIESASSFPYFRLLKGRVRVLPPALAIIFPVAFVIILMGKNVYHINPLTLVPDFHN
jgi:hypothetical protein